jgi:peptidyl-dipeptidase A
LIDLSNRGAQKGGFLNIGTLWQKEMEIDNVEDLMLKLLYEVQPFYNMLHAFVKLILEKRFAFTSSKLNMPAHLLGWNANWHHLLEDYVEIDGWHIDETLAARQWSSHDVVKRIEDFYTSLGLNRLTSDFWEKSIIEGG